MTITTEHNGYVIHYVETENIWHCPYLGLRSTALAGLRTLIDQADSEARQLSIPAFLIDHSGFSITPVLVVRSDRDGENAWIINKLDDPRNARREKVSLQRLVEDTQENRQLLLAWRDASRAVYEEGQRVSQRRDAIPRLRIAPLQPETSTAKPQKLGVSG